jgi:hypothetical protein
MNENLTFETKLALLQEILDKKQAALTIVLNISENQETLYLSPPSEERREFLMEMGKEKQNQIDEVMACDEVFQSIFDGMADEFAIKGRDHKEKVEKLQISINEVLELDVKIRAQEEKSKTAAAAGFGQRPGRADINPANVNYILDKYRDASKNKPNLTEGNQ